MLSNTHAEEANGNCADERKGKQLALVKGQKWMSGLLAHFRRHKVQVARNKVMHLGVMVSCT